MQLLIDDIDVHTLVGGSGRVKYTCIDVSKRYLILGANIGSLYFFERRSISTIISKPNQLQNTQAPSIVIPNTGIVIAGNYFSNDNLTFTQILSRSDIRESITHVKFCPTNDNLLAIVTSAKVVYVFEHNLSTHREKEKLIFKMSDHPKDATEICSITWSPCGNYLFSSDDLGNVYCSSVAKARRSFFFSGELAIKCDSKVVQVDVIAVRPSEVPAGQVHVAYVLLLSSLTKTVVVTFQINQGTNSGRVMSSVGIGKKQRENTKQGACFHPFYRNSVYAARPGKRLWLADRLDGKVLSTMNYSSEDGAPPAKPKSLTNDGSAITGNHALVFSKLLPYGNFIISWDDKSILLVDVNEVEILEWRLDTNLIFDTCIHEGSIYVLHGASRSISRVYSSIPLPSNPVDEDIITYTTEPMVQPPVQTQPQQEETLSSSSQIQPPPPSQDTIVTPPPVPKQEVQQQSATTSITTTPLSSNTDITETSSVNDSTHETVSLNTSTSSTITTDDNNMGEEPTTPVNVPTPVPVVAQTTINTSTAPIPATTTTTSTPTPTPIPTPTPTPPPTLSTSSSKVDLFSGIQLSSEPLVAVTSAGMTPKSDTTTTTKKLVKKKIIKVGSQSNMSDQTSTTGVTNGSALLKTQDTPTPTPDSLQNIPSGTNEPKRTVVIKKKIVKKPKSSDATDPQTNATQSTANVPSATSPSPVQINDNSSMTAKTDSAAVPTATTATATPAVPATTVGQGIFNTAVSSLQKINQIANKIQKQTSEITSDITQKILGDSTAVAGGTGTPVASTTTADQLNASTTLAPPVPAVLEDPLDSLDRLTKQTHEALLVFKYQKNENAFLPMLQSWLNAFHAVESPNPNDQITEIVTACFILGINLNSQHESGKICKCWDEKIAIESVNKYLQYMDKNRVILHCNHLKWDQCIEQLLVFEPLHMVRQDSKVINTVNQFVEAGNITNAMNLLDQYASSQYSMLFRYIKPLISLDSLVASAFYAKHYPIIQPRNILALINESPVSKIEYLSHLIEQHQDCKYDSALINEWFSICASQLPEHASSLFHEESTPALRSHLVQWKYRDTMLLIIKHVINNDYFGTIEHLESVSKSSGFWEGLLEIYLHCHEAYSAKSITVNQELSDSYAKKAIELCIHTDNTSEFIRFMENTTNTDYWAFTLASMQSLRDTYKEDSTFEISELLIAKVMGRAIGPLQTVEIISKSKLFESKDSSKISPLILSEWIRNGKWSLYNRSKLSYDILNGLDSHLWLKKPLTISPQILSLLGPEIDRSLPPHPFSSTSQNLQSPSSPIDSSSEENKFKYEIGVMPQFFEDNARRHWGIETELHHGVCPICTLPLSENPESSFLGSTPAIITVFANCGHSYHQCCIEEQGCSLCFSKR